MATADEYAAWIVQNAGKKGTPEFEIVAKAYELAKSSGVPNMNSPEFQAKVVAQEAADRERYNPTSGMSPFERFRAGMGKGMVTAGRGVGQLLGLTNDADIAEAKKNDAPLEATTGGRVGELAGTMAVFAPTAMIPGANTVTGAGLIGGLSSALLTPGSAGDRGVAGLMGAAGGIAGQMLPQVVRTITAAAEPLTQAGQSKIIGRVMNRTVGDNASDVIAKLKSAKPLVPDSLPTAAEVAESGGIAALQRAMSAADPEAYAHRGMQQSAARIQALRGIAGDEGQREFFDAARKATGNQLYEDAFKNYTGAPTPYIKGQITQLLKRPSIDDASRLAQTLARERGEKPSAIGSLRALHDVKTILDDKIAEAVRAGQGGQVKALTETQAKLLNVMEAMSPEYRTARETYAAMSRPINQMDVGQYMLDKLRPALADHGALAKETGSAYAAALRDAESLVRKATGKDFPLDKIMEPRQLDTLKAVAQDLARKSNAQDLGRGGVGSNTFQNFAMDNLSQSMGMPSAVRTVLGAIPGISATGTLAARGGQALGKLAYRNADEAMRMRMAQALLNPQEAGALMEAAIRPSALAQALQRLPAQVQKALPPDEILRLMQSAPGVMGSSIGVLPARQ